MGHLEELLSVASGAAAVVETGPGRRSPAAPRRSPLLRARRARAAKGAPRTGAGGSGSWPKWSHVGMSRADSGSRPVSRSSRRSGGDPAAAGGAPSSSTDAGLGVGPRGTTSTRDVRSRRRRRAAARLAACPPGGLARHGTVPDGNGRNIGNHVPGILWIRRRGVRGLRLRLPGIRQSGGKPTPRCMRRAGGGRCAALPPGCPRPGRRVRAVIGGRSGAHRRLAAPGKRPPR